MLKLVPIEKPSVIYEEAARFGQLPVVQWALSKKFPLPPYNKIFSIAAQYRQWEILHFLHKNDFPLTENVAESAAAGGDLEILKWLVNNGCKLTERCAVEAANNSHSEVFLWLVENGCNANFFGVYGINVTNIDILKWAAFNGHGGYFRDSRYTTLLVRNNCLEDLQWLYEKGYFSDSHQRACLVASARGDLIIIEWLLSIGCYWDEQCATEAAWYGHLHIIQWVIENGLPRNNKQILQISAQECYLHILQWFSQHENFVMPPLTIHGTIKSNI